VDFEDNMHARMHDARDTTINSRENWKIMAEDQVRGIRMKKWRKSTYVDYTILNFNFPLYIRYFGHYF
jgi:hypothetical protein